MRTEIQQQLIAAYEDLAISRAACNSVMAGLAAVCLEYGIDETVLNVVNERARRAVARQLPAVVGSLTEMAKEP
jgi:hypothetical protein